VLEGVFLPKYRFGTGGNHCTAACSNRFPTYRRWEPFYCGNWSERKREGDIVKATGRLISWRVDRGFGWAASDDGGADVFVHISECPGGAPEVGQRVSFVLTATPKGPRASAVELLPEVHNGNRR